MTEVLELFAADEVTPVPGAPPVVAGLVHRRGAAVPVVHLPHPFRQGAAVRAGQALLLVEHGGTTCALPVDEALGIRELDPDAAAPATSRIPWIRARHEVDGVGTPVHVVDLGVLVETWRQAVAAQGATVSGGAP